MTAPFIKPPRPDARGKAGEGTLFASDDRVNFQLETSKYFYTEEDGVSYEYDQKARAWFPMVRCVTRVV